MSILPGDPDFEAARSSALDDERFHHQSTKDYAERLRSERDKAVESLGEVRGKYTEQGHRIKALEAELARAPTQAVELERLRAAAGSFRRADTEYGRAGNAGAQPRLSNAGTSYVIAKHRLFKALDAALTPANQEEQGS